MSLFIAGGMAKHAGKLVKQFKLKNMWKEYWLYTLLWIVLLVWAIKELFFF